MTPLAAPRGTKDLLPDEAPAWRWLHELHRAVAETFGYQIVDTPLFESTELFARGVGGSTDIVAKEMYTFADRKGRSLTLRPEGTAPVVRAALSAHLDQAWRPVRLQYAMAMFRYDRPQDLRQRQFHQVGVECIGERDPALDAEVIELAWRFMAEMRLEGVALQVNTLGDQDDRARYRETLTAYYRPLQDQLCDDCRRRLDVNPLRLLDCKKDSHLVAAAPLIGEHLSAESRTYFEAVLRHLEVSQVPFSRNPRLVRGLDYYEHTAFEFWHTSLEGAQNALGGGGRYDGLAQQLGFPPAPGVGYALGVERLLRIATDLGVAPRPQPPAFVVVCSVEQSDESVACELTRRLRQRTSVVSDLTDRRLDRKLRDAGRVGARLAMLVGVDAAIVMRDLTSGEQREVALDDALDAVSAVLIRVAQEGSA